MSGWTKIAENTITYVGTQFHMLVYSKGEDAAIIETFTYSGMGNLLVILAGPQAGLGKIAEWAT